MKRFFTIIDQLIIESYILFPNMLLAYAIEINKNTITFAWPFILGYSVGQVTPFFLNENLHKNWQNNYFLLALTATISSLLASCGIFLHLEAFVSLGAIGFSFGVTGLANLSNLNHQKYHIKFLNLIASFLMVIVLLLLGFLLMKVSLLSAYLLYAFILTLECVGIYLLFRPTLPPLSQLFNFSSRETSLGIVLFTAIFLISLFKKMGKFPDISWIFIILASLGIILTLKKYLVQIFKAFDVWLGALRNYMIIFTLIFAFQQHQPTWIFIVFIEMSIAGILSKLASLALNRLSLTKQFYLEISLIFLSLILIIWTKFYLLGVGLIFTLLILISSVLKKIKPITKNGIIQKISVLGSLWSQVILFAMFQIISKLEFNNKTTLILPFIDHRSALQYNPEMTFIRIVMCLLFIITGILVIIHDRKLLIDSHQ